MAELERTSAAECGMHLRRVHQIDARSERRGDVDRLVHLLDARTALQTRSRVGVDAVGALLAVRDREPDERFFATGQGAIGGRRMLVVSEKLLPCAAREPTDLAESAEIGALV